MVTARIPSPVVIAERVSTRFRFEGLCNYAGGAGHGIRCCPQQDWRWVDNRYTVVGVARGIRRGHQHACRWKRNHHSATAAARGIRRRHQQGCRGGDRSIAAGVGNGSNERHQPDWVSGGTSA